MGYVHSKLHIEASSDKLCVAEVHVAGVSQRQLLTLEMDILGNNNKLAENNREHFQKLINSLCLI